MARGRWRRGRAAGVDPAPDAELNVRGRTVDAALELLDGFLSEAREAGHGRLKVVHGKGTRSPGGHSVVRDAVRGHLESARKKGRIRDYRGGNVGEGGSGVTIIWL